MMQRTVILGLGNTLLADEAVGVYVIESLRPRLARYPAVELIDGGTLSFTLLEHIEDAAALIVVDAAQLCGAPGSVEVFEGSDLDRFVGGGKLSSVHEISLAELLSMAALRDTLPAQRALVAIQPGRVQWSNELTPPVAAALDIAIARITHLLSTWHVLPCTSTS